MLCYILGHVVLHLRTCVDYMTIQLFCVKYTHHIHGHLYSDYIVTVNICTCIKNHSLSHLHLSSGFLWQFSYIYICLEICPGHNWAAIAACSLQSLGYIVLI